MGQMEKMHIKSMGFCKEELKISLVLLMVFKGIFHVEMQVRPAK